MFLVQWLGVRNLVQSQTTLRENAPQFPTQWERSARISAIAVTEWWALLGLLVWQVLMVELKGSGATRNLFVRVSSLELFFLTIIAIFLTKAYFSVTYFVEECNIVVLWWLESHFLNNETRVIFSEKLDLSHIFRMTWVTDPKWLDFTKWFSYRSDLRTLASRCERQRGMHWRRVCRFSLLCCLSLRIQSTRTKSSSVLDWRPVVSQTRSMHRCGFEFVGNQPTDKTRYG